ncbi:hypothetical protein CITRIK5_60005 [Citricoccus sp. K5]|nr:hypothetical protein CITRIK5_60005 [Citricoccus sp. K5]
MRNGAIWNVTEQFDIVSSCYAFYVTLFQNRTSEYKLPIREGSNYGFDKLSIESTAHFPNVTNGDRSIGS